MNHRKADLCVLINYISDNYMSVSAQAVKKGNGFLITVISKSKRYFGMGLPKYIFKCRLHFRESLSVASNNAGVQFVRV